MTDVRTKHRLYALSQCFICRRRVYGASDGEYHTDLRIVVHHGPCCALVRRHRFTREKSKHGRWVPPAEVLRRVEAELGR